MIVPDLAGLRVGITHLQSQAVPYRNTNALGAHVTKSYDSGWKDPGEIQTGSAVVRVEVISIPGDNLLQILNRSRARSGWLLERGQRLA